MILSLVVPCDSSQDLSMLVPPREAKPRNKNQIWAGVARRLEIVEMEARLIVNKRETL